MFWDKKLQRYGFLGLFRSALKRLGILLYDSDDAQTYSIPTHLVAKGVTRIKTTTLKAKMLRFEPKSVEKRGLLGFHTIFH